MQYHVYVDLPRRLTNEERSTLCKALEANVPDGGCVGLQQGPNDEVYFCVEAFSDAEALAQAGHYANSIFREAGLNDNCALTLQKNPCA